MAKGNILIIDDELQLCTSLSENLKIHGYQTEYCTSAASGIDLGCKGNYDVILIDLKMPDIDGIGIIKRIKNFNPQAGCIIVTGYPSGTTIKEAIDLGACDYIMKPFEMNNLLSVIDKVIVSKTPQED